MSETTIIAGVSCVVAVVSTTFMVWRGGGGKRLEFLESKATSHEVAIAELRTSKVSSKSFDREMVRISEKLDQKFEDIHEQLSELNKNVCVLKDRAHRNDGGTT